MAEPAGGPTVARTAVRKILLVDDSRTEVHVLSEALGKEGFDVRAAANAEEALLRLEEDVPDLILMDVVMPGKSGFHLTRAIKRDPRWASVPVIMCSNRSQITDKVWGLRQGARDYLVKPVRIDELLARIRSLGEPAQP